VELFFKCLKRRQKKKKSGGMQAPLLQNDTLEMIQMPPSSTDAESYSEISTKADVNIQVQVPQNAPPGTVLAVTAPDGRQVQCSVPPGMAPGAVFTVAIPDLQRTDCMLPVQHNAALPPSVASGRECAVHITPAADTSAENAAESDAEPKAPVTQPEETTSSHAGAVLISLIVI
jgi:hypothetical protein